MAARLLACLTRQKFLADFDFGSWRLGLGARDSRIHRSARLTMARKRTLSHVVLALLVCFPASGFGGKVREMITRNTLGNPYGIAVDELGNVYVAGHSSHNAFKITVSGAITEIIDRTGDGLGGVSRFSSVRVVTVAMVYSAANRPLES